MIKSMIIIEVPNNRPMYLNGFRTPRLIIRALTERDIPLWSEFFFDSSVYEFIGLDDSVCPCTHSKTWINRQLKRYESGDWGLMALVEYEEMELVGQCGIITMNVESESELEIGYHIIEKHRGKGYAGEAARFLRDWVFENKLAETLLAVIHVDNKISQSVATSLGMKRERETVCMSRPAYRYVIAREEWVKLRKREK